VMGAMLEQLSPRVVVTKFERIARASQDVISTNLPASELGRFVDLALKAKSQPLATVSFVPPMINTGDPDIDLIHARVEQAIEKSESRTDGGGTSRPKHKRPASGSGDAPVTTGGSIGNLSDGYAANQAEDLSTAC
jgi:polyisoprenyl-teichoic acid--peptidoglycan teichoic acid transferase